MTSAPVLVLVMYTGILEHRSAQSIALRQLNCIQMRAFPRTTTHILVGHVALVLGLGVKVGLPGRGGIGDPRSSK